MFKLKLVRLWGIISHKKYSKEWKALSIMLTAGKTIKHSSRQKLVICKISCRLATSIILGIFELLW